jgi:PAS domain S-box-containing protein
MSIDLTANTNRDFLDLIQHGVSLFDKDLNLVICNDQYLSLLDLPKDFATPGTNLSTLIRYHAERGDYGREKPIDALVDERMNLAQNGERYTFERQHPDGKILLVQGTPVADGGFLFTHIDITDSQNAEKALKQDNQDLERQVQLRTRELQQKQQEDAERMAILQSTVESMSHGITLLDRDLNLVVCNKKFLELMDFPEELGRPGTPFKKLVDYNYARGEYGDDEREKVVNALIEKTKKFEPHNFHRTRPNGTTIEIIGNPIEQGFITTYRDVTSETAALNRLRRQFETNAKKLAQTNDLLQNVLDTIPVRVFWKDHEAKYLGANKLFIEDAGYTWVSDLLGKTDHQLPWPEQAELFQLDDFEVMKTNTSKLNIIEKQERPDGGISWRKTNKVPMHGPDGAVVGVLGTYEDISALKQQELATQESEARFRALFDETFQFIGLLDTEGRLLEINKTAADRFNISKMEAQGKFFPDTQFWTHSKTERAKIVRAIDKAVSSGEFSRFNTYHISPEGERIHVDFSLKPIFNDQGDVVMLLPEGRDITDKVESERELHRTQQWLMAHFEHTPLAVIQWDMDFRVAQWNDAASQIFGYSKEEAIGQHATFIVEEKLHPIFDQVFDELVQNQGGFRSTNENLTKDRQVITCEWYNTPLADDTGDIIGIASFVDDITDQVIAQQDLKESEERYILALKGVNDGIFDWNIAKRTIYFSETAASVMEIPFGNHEYDDDTLLLKMGLHNQEQFKRILKAHLKGHSDFFAYEFSYENQERETVWVLCRGLALRNDQGRCYRMSGSISDITDRKKVEREVKELTDNLEHRVQTRTQELEEANRELSQTLSMLHEAQDELVQSEKMASLGGLVSGVAHEVNTPIGVGVTAASHLLDEVEALEAAFRDNSLKKSDFEAFFLHAQDSAKMILSNLSRAAKLIGSFKQVAVDRTSEDYRQINLSNYVQEIFLSLTPKLKNTQITTRLDIDETIELTTDPGALAQVVTNLVMNSLTHAFKLGEKGTISISCDHLDDGYQMLYRDDGCGMTEDVAANIYEPFFTTRRGEGGSGLGMNIVFNLVTQRMQGKIKCVTSPGHGSEFHIFFPKDHKSGE